jgi:barstar (barnase inhibitor)
VSVSVEPGAQALVVRVPPRLKDRSALFDVLQSGLRFPYFGRNWDALLDLISDLSWLEVDEVWIVHTMQPVGLEDIWQTYVDVLTGAVDRRNDAVSRGFPDRPELVIALPRRDITHDSD